MPNLFTTGTLFGGFYAIVAAINGQFSRAGIAVFVAMLFDGLDGRVARWTNTQSDFGKEYDSLCDMVAFGVAPAIVVYQWGIARIADYGQLWGRFGWLAAFFYAVAAALRLARFNSRTAVVHKRYFEGLPSPSAAATVASFVWLVSEFDVTGLPALVLAFVVTICIGALMVSRFSYWSGKDLNVRGRIPWVYAAVIPLIYDYPTSRGLRPPGARTRLSPAALPRTPRPAPPAAETLNVLVFLLLAAFAGLMFYQYRSEKPQRWAVEDIAAQTYNGLAGKPLLDAQKVEPTAEQSPGPSTAASQPKVAVAAAGKAPEAVASKALAANPFARVKVIIYFPYNSNELTPEALAALDRIAEFLQASPNLKAEIRGYTDSVGAVNYNVSVSAFRGRIRSRVT